MRFKRLKQLLADASDLLNVPDFTEWAVGDDAIGGHRSNPRKLTELAQRRRINVDRLQPSVLREWAFSHVTQLVKVFSFSFSALDQVVDPTGSPETPTVEEVGYDMTFANWRGFFGAPGLSQAKADAYRAVLKKMYATSEWEDVRSKRGWQNLYQPGDEFVSFLEKQEKEIGSMMRILGFLQ